MRITCPRCHAEISLLADRIPGSLFSLHCEECRAALFVELSVRAPLPYQSDAKLPLSDSQPPLEPTVPITKGLVDSGAGAVPKLVIKVLQGERDEIPVLNRVAVKLRAIMENPRSHSTEIVELVRSDQALASRLV